MSEKGSLSINSENLFPIIKKWLYSDHDIFIREMISNACDAVTKLRKLEVMGETSIPEDYKYKIDVVVDPETKTIKFIDNGIGMTEDEVKEYINQIAFSGATDFIEKYKDKANEDQIIGHFGLGFYSSFMVAEKVTIDTLSYKEGSKAVHWESEDGMNYVIEDSEWTSEGTCITVYLNDVSYEFSNQFRVREVLSKYCSFVPVEVYLSAEKAETEYETVDAADVTEDDVVVENIVEEAKMEERENEQGEKEMVEVSPRAEKAKIVKRPVAINNTRPLWTKHPNDCTEEEYKDFYREVFKDYKEPLFWIHLNMDYPFNLKGVLYFPKLNLEVENLEGVIKLYNNQVFVADNIKEVIPEFLLLLKGAIDCPDLPLNVSRSALQNDGFVTKISDYITKKVADKLTGMSKVEKEEYEKYWEDISPFIKYGFLRDEKFREKIKDVILFKNLEGKYVTLKEYVGTPEEGAEDEAADKAGKDGDAGKKEEGATEEDEKKVNIYYVTDEQQQSQYVNLFKGEGKDALVLTHSIDQPFITQLEHADPTLRFLRIDADITDEFKEETGEDELKEETEKLSKVFRKALGKEKLEVKVEKLKNEKLSSVITLSEDARRMQDMMKMYGMADLGMNDMGGGETLVLNANNEVVKYILADAEGEGVETICHQLYDLAMLSHRPLSSEALTGFVARSNEILMSFANKK